MPSLSIQREHLSCLGKLSYSSLSLDQLPTFYPLSFQFCEISLRIPLMWRFSSVSLPPVRLHLFITSTFLIYADKFALTEFLCCRCRVSPETWAMPTFPGSVLSSIYTFTIDLNFSITSCCFFTAFSYLLTIFLFWLSAFVKCWMALSLEGKKTT